MSRALVTGATGFIGHHLVERLTELGASVCCLVRESSDRSRLQVHQPEFRIGDVTDFETLHSAVAECDVVYHLAGLTKSVPAEVMWRVNEEGVRNIARICALQQKPPVLVVLSSLAAAGPAPRDRPLTEADPPRPVSKYGLSKFKGEQAAYEYADQVPISILRAPIVFGEGDLDGLALFTSIAKTRLHMSPTLRDYRFSFIHAADLSNAMIQVGDHGERLSPEGPRASDAGIYFLAAEMNPTYAEYGRMIGKAMNIKRVFACPNLPTTIWLIGAGSELYSRAMRRPNIMNWDKTREALAGSWACSPARLNEQVGFRTNKDLHERLKQTVNWYVENGHLPGRFAADT